jgi:hypothetical protein
MRADGRLTDDTLVIRVRFVKPANPQGGVTLAVINACCTAPRRPARDARDAQRR